MVEIETTEDGVCCKVDASCHISTSGGEMQDDDFELDEYSLHIDDLTVCGLSSSQLSKLVVQAINHLRTNGHVYEHRIREADGQTDLVEVDIRSKKILVGVTGESYKKTAPY